jgi:RimJ/RimL family protein N-acetyltransferase
MAIEELRTHQIILADGPIRLRPLTEADWPVLMRWCADPQVLYYSEGDDVSSRSPGEIQAIYRQVSQNALCFVIERDGAPVGDGWLQRMNLERLLARFPDLDCRRIDLQLARDCWGQGAGGACVRLLTAFAFETEGADAVFGCDVADYNARSRRVFEREGFSVVGAEVQPPGAKAAVTYDFVRFRSPAAASG